MVTQTITEHGAMSRAFHNKYEIQEKDFVRVKAMLDYYFACQDILKFIDQEKDHYAKIGHNFDNMKYDTLNNLTMRYLSLKTNNEINNRQENLCNIFDI